MAAQAARAHAPAAPARPRTPARARGLPRRRLAGSLVWIAVVAVLLAGIVALNVAVLRLNLRLDELGSEQTRLRTENANLRNEAAVGAVPQNIRTAATEQGYRAVGWTKTRYLELDPAAP